MKTDLLVIGSGAGGWMWIPRNTLARNAGMDEHPSSPRNYLQLELDEKYDDERVESFLYHAPRLLTGANSVSTSASCARRWT